MKHPWILDWNEAEATGPTIAGGKGWNLGRLFRYGFHVPPGGVLSAAAYTRFMEHPRLVQLQAELSSLSADDAADPHNLTKLEEMQTIIKSTPIPDEIADEIRQFLIVSGLDNVPVAVRSSATAEDSATASFAGIHASFLGQVGPDAVLNSIRGCYASLWTPQAVAYRRRFGLLDSDVLCGIVLCRMVGEAGDPIRPPRAAGVAFSCDPRSGRVDVVTIGAARGLGVAVVDGSSTPEEIVVQAGLDPKVLERSGENDYVLTDDEAIRLAHLVQRVQWALGEGQDPQDVEWAFDGTTFWLVQARPVTRLPRHTFEGAKELPLIWSNANLKDALPVVLSPLGWSMTQSIIRHNLFAPHVAAGYPIPPGLEMIRRFHGRAYFDLTTLFWAFYDSLGMTSNEFNRSMGGHQPEFTVPHPDPMNGPERNRLNRGRMKLLRAVLRLDKSLPSIIQTRFEAVRRYRGVDLSQESMDQLRRRLEEQIEISLEFGPLSMLANTSAGLWHQFLEQIVAKVAPDDYFNLTSHLLAGSGSVVSAEHGSRLLDLAAAVQNDPAAQALLKDEKTFAFGWKHLPSDSPFRMELERFLTDFGHRAVYEVDVANPRWIEDPTYILQQVRLLLEAGFPGDLLKSAKERRLVAEKTINERTFVWRPLIRWLARRARHGFAMREAAKSALVSHLEPCRYVILELGRRMQHAGVLNEPDDIFYLTWIEIDAFMLSWWDGNGAKTLVMDRKAQEEAWLKENPPDVIMSDAMSDSASITQLSSSHSDQGSAPAPSGTTLRGTGVAAGNATAAVRILRHPNEGEKLGTGEILVAPSTDPGWTPLFMRAAAIVMEVGGYHSHGAIVARELGIPAVANVPNVLTTLKDGDVITVNGDTGTIVRRA